MFFRSKARCPIDAEAAEWVEGSFRWLVETLGYDPMCERPVMTPTPEFFPHPIQVSAKSVRDTLDRIATHMGLNPDEIELKFYSEESSDDLAPGFPIVSDGKGSAGLYESGQIQTVWLEVSRCRDAVSMIAVIAHELAHAVLIGGGHVNMEREDDEDITDLATVYLGLGIFNANAAVTENQWSSGGWHGWSVGTLGYLDEPMFAYALAYFAKARNEKKPAWAKHLSPYVHKMFKETLAWFEKQS